MKASYKTMSIGFVFENLNFLTMEKHFLKLRLSYLEDTVINTPVSLYILRVGVSLNRIGLRISVGENWDN